MYCQGDADGAGRDRGADWCGSARTGPSAISGRPALLGRITVRVDEVPRIGEAHVVMGHLEAVDGRKITTASALHDGAGRLLALARATWIALRA